VWRPKAGSLGIDDRGSHLAFEQLKKNQILSMAAPSSERMGLAPRSPSCLGKSRTCRRMPVISSSDEHAQRIQHAVDIERERL